MKLEICGRRIEVVRVDGGWAAYHSGNDGKRRPARDLNIPGELGEHEVEQFLSDLLHGYAVPGADSATMVRDAGIFDPDAVRRRLERCWSVNTSRQWSRDNPANGQCAVTSLVLQDVYSGSLLKTRVGDAWHFYNEIDGRNVDLTASQFSKPVNYSDDPATRVEALRDCRAEEYAELSRRFHASAAASAR